MSTDQRSKGLKNLQRITETLQLHDKAMSATICGITIADASLPDMPLIYINDAFEQITGYAPSEVLGKNCRFLQADDRDQDAVKEIRAAIKEQRHCDVVLRNYRKDGTSFWNQLIISPIFDDDGQLTHFVGVQNDVTEREEAKSLAIQRQKELEIVLEELRSTQAMLIHSEKMNALGQMVAGVAHEINNPLAFVSSNLYSLEQSVEDITNAFQDVETYIQAQGSAEQQAAIAQIRSKHSIDFALEDIEDLISESMVGLERVKKIVKGLRTFSRLDEAERKMINLQENIEVTLGIAQPQLGKNIETHLEISDLPEIRCYPAELNQVFLNLIVNAAQAMPDGGTLHIIGQDFDNQIVLKFRDTGMGIPDNVIERIFEPFFTTKPVGVGTGLGLSIAYKIMTELHRGKISVESMPGSGTTFTLTIPKNL